MSVRDWIESVIDIITIFMLVASIIAPPVLAALGTYLVLKWWAP